MGHMFSFIRQFSNFQTWLDGFLSQAEKPVGRGNDAKTWAPFSAALSRPDQVAEE